MGIISKEVEVAINGRNIKYYKSLGYEIPMRKSAKGTLRNTGNKFSYDIGATILVKPEDLPKRSPAIVEVICDVCNKNKRYLSYAAYCSTVERSGSYACRKCSYERTFETTKKRYGYRYSSQIPEIRTKMNESFYKNGSQKSSTQQRYLHGLYGGKINYPIKYYNADICFPEEKLIIEYDGGGHNLNVKTRRLTQQEFEQKEITRNNIIKREGYKSIRIQSKTDKLPSDPILVQMLSYARNYFSQYPNHSWIEFNIDISLVRSAENKNGVFFDFGKLRKIHSANTRTQDNQEKGA